MTNAPVILQSATHNLNNGYLRELSTLPAASFASLEGSTQAILELIAEQLGLRSSYITHVVPEEDLNEVVAAYNKPGGCNVSAGGRGSLEKTY